MAEERAVLKVTKDLKAAVSTILQGYGDGLGPVTDASAELHRLCGCLEWLLQFDQKEQKSFLGPRKDYWDFLCTALRRQRGDTEPDRFVHSQDKLKTPLGKGRAFIRFCLARGQLAESLQLCLLSPELTREWYGPRSPLLCPELQEDILDSLYALNGVAFDLDLQRADLDGAWPMFSESRCPNSSWTQGRRPRKNKDSSKEISAAFGAPRGVQLEEPHISQAGCLRDAPREDWGTGFSGSQQHSHPPQFGGTKNDNSRSLESLQSMWKPGAEGHKLDQEEGAPRIELFRESSAPRTPRQGERAKGAQKEGTGTETECIGPLLGSKGQRTTEDAHGQRLPASNPREKLEEATSGRGREWEEPNGLEESWVWDSATAEKPEEQAGVTCMARKEEQAEVPLQDMVKSLQRRLQTAKEQAQHQAQLLEEQEVQLQTLRGQLSRCQEERARLQAELEQKQQEADRRAAMYEEELGGQRDLVRAMKRRVLELIQEKDRQWQKLQHLSSVAPGCCVACSKIFGRLSRRYPCRLCGGLVCHACSADFKKRERLCPPCAQGGETQIT